ncbi:unnamed protein product [Brachionus calyciflorus]|uniref:Ig-like domain-containing protein n=1 Tax=Brachionus calyciflorus TaxID=104777 RepID=A0A813M6V8_9BILA|nr:unnamed protein product [Brachionus calyciflorus]
MLIECHKSLYFLISLALLNIVNSLEIVNYPSDQFVNLYENAIFKCKIKDYKKENDIIEWCKNDFCTWGRLIELPDGRLKYKSLSKFYIIGDRKNGEWNLLLENVTSNDVGNYKCSVTRRNDQSVFKLSSNSASLKIMEKPSTIELNHPNSIEIILDKSQDIDCIVEKSVPDPSVTWFMLDTNIFNELISNKNNLNDKRSIRLVDKKNSSFRMNIFKSSNSVYINRLSLNGSMDLLNKTVIAIIEHPLIPEPVIKSVKIELKYPPILSISYEPKEPLEEDKTYTFYCNSKSDEEIKIPNNFYFMNENHKFQSINGSIKLKLNRKMNGSFLVCEDTNLIGKSIINYSLDIIYAPRFIHVPDPIIIVNKSTDSLRLKCKVDSNPKSEIFWVKNENEIIHKGENLLLNQDLNGEYECQAKTMGFDPVVSRVAVVNEGPPSIYGQNLYFFETNKELNIRFSVLSSPSYHSGPICYKIDMNTSSVLKIIYPSRNKEKYQIYEDDLNELKISTKFRLRITNPSEDDIGIYNCTFSNQFGDSFFKFEINKKEPVNVSLALTLIIIFSIIISFLIMSILILICVQRKRNRNSMGKKSLPSVSDHSGYEQNDKLTNSQYQIFSCEKITVVNNGCMSKNLSDDRKIDNSFKKQSNQISLIMNDQNSLESLSECLKFPSDTQNLILIDKLKSISQSENSNGNNHQKANIYSSRFQTNV